MEEDAELFTAPAEEAPGHPLRTKFSGRINTGHLNAKAETHQNS